MKQEIIKFVFRKKDDEFLVNSKNNLAFNHIENWPNWDIKITYIYGSKKCGKTSISKLWKEKSGAIKLGKKKFLTLMDEPNNFEKIKNGNWIIDDIDLWIKDKKNRFDEKILNFINIVLSNKDCFFLITSSVPPKSLSTDLKDLLSRLSASLVIQVKEPDNELLKKLILKYLSERNILLEETLSEYIIQRIERSYKKCLEIARKIDKESLRSKKKVNISLLKKIIKIDN